MDKRYTFWDKMSVNLLGIANLLYPYQYRAFDRAFALFQMSPHLSN